MHIWQNVDVPKHYFGYGNPSYNASDEKVGGYKWYHQMHQFLHCDPGHLASNMTTFFFCIISGEMLFGSSIMFIVFWTLFWTIDLGVSKNSIGASESTYFILHFVWTVNLLHFWLFNKAKNMNLTLRMLAWLDYASCCCFVLMFHSLYQSIRRSKNTNHNTHGRGSIVGLCAGLFVIPIFMFRIYRSRQWRITKMDYIHSAALAASGLLIFVNPSLID